MLPQVEHIDTEATVIQRKHGPFLAGSRNRHCFPHDIVFGAMKDKRLRESQGILHFDSKKQLKLGRVWHG